MKKRQAFKSRVNKRKKYAILKMDFSQQVNSILYTPRIKKLEAMQPKTNIYRQYSSIPSRSKTQRLVCGVKSTSGISSFIAHIIEEKKKNTLYRIVTEDIQISSMIISGGKVLLAQMALNIL